MHALLHVFLGTLLLILLLFSIQAYVYTALDTVGQKGHLLQASGKQDSIFTS